MRTYIGVDLGTSAIKLILVDEKGNILNQASEEYPLLFPHPGWSEQNPSEWWNAFLKAYKSLLNGFDKRDIQGLSIAGQMHGLVILDENNEVIRPAILWNDGRTNKETDYLNNVIGKDKLTSLVSNFAFAGFTAPKILWVKNNEKENFKKIRHILLPKDYLVFMLTHQYSCDYSDASGMLLLDVEHKRRSDEMIDIVGIKKEFLPTLHESYEPVGNIVKEVKDILGLDNDVLVMAGAGDNAGATIGVGCVKDNDCNISLGTSGTVFLATDKHYFDKEVALHSFNHANGKYHLMGCILSAASCFKWWVKDILSSDYEKEWQDIEKYLGESKVLFAPYMMGERCPYNDVEVRGGFVNLSLNTSKEEMTLAILEGVTFALRDCVELMRSKGIKISKTTLCGGGSKTPIWPRLLANILNVEVRFVETEQGPSYGAAILAMVGTGLYKDVEEATNKIVKYVKTIKPENDLVEKYEKKYRDYIKLYPALSSVK